MRAVSTIVINFQQSGYTRAQWTRLTSGIETLHATTRVNKSRISADALMRGLGLAAVSLDPETITEEKDNTDEL